VGVIFSILYAIPHVSIGLVSWKEEENKEGNLILFERFPKMSLKDYEWSMHRLMSDKD